MRIYPSKIMLYGEYSVLIDGNALVIPYADLKGAWKETGKPAVYDKLLEDSGFINKIPDVDFIDHERFHKERQEGHYYDSDIPIGAGLGSSAAFSAAVYDRYGPDPSLKDVSHVHKQLQKLENIFHGSSSGIDPLVSFYQKAIWMKNEEYHFPEAEFDLSGLFLVPSGLVRGTKTLVDKFRRQAENQEYNRHLTHYSGLVDLAISHLISHNTFEPENWKKLSAIQLRLFAPMIPYRMEQVWRRGLKSERYFMKLCGAGGGGYFLCYYPDQKISTQSDWLAL